MVKTIEVSKIIGGSNVRNEKDESITELAASIDQNGLLQPITVRQMGNLYEVIAGHRRLEAIKLLKEPFVECNIIDCSDKDRVILQCIENIQRKNMSAYELVSVFDEMKQKYSCTNKSLARYFNKPDSWVADQYMAVRLLNKQYESGIIPEEAKKMSAGTIKTKFTKKRKGDSIAIECNGFNVRHNGHSYVINCFTGEAEVEIMQFIEQRKLK